MSSSHLLGNLGPCLLEPVDGAAVERRGDFQHPIVVVQTPADIGHCHPLLDGVGPGADVRVRHDLRGNEVTHLQRQEEVQDQGMGSRTPGNKAASVL